MRIGGLASGMNTDEIIRDMMNANRIPLNKIVQKKQYLDWQVDDYRKTNRQLNDYSTNLWNKMLNPATSGFRSKTVESSAPDDVTIKALSSAGELSGTLQIHQLAKNATMQSGKINATKDTTLEDLGIVAGESGTINIAGDDIELSSTDSIEKVISKINAKGKVNAFFDEQSGQIAMTAKNSGKGNIEVTGEGAFIKALKLGANASRQEGTDAEFTFNGLRTTRSSNTFEISGFEITLKQASGTTDAKTITFSSKASVDDIFDTVKGFVEDYNKMIEELNAKIREPKYRSYHPLSAEEKAEMKEKEIELWEEKAMSGTLRNDPTITNMLSQMRTALMGSIGGQGGPTLRDIGITTSKDYLANGKLEIDEEALKKAISEDPSKVEQMFTAGNKDTPQQEQGFAVRLRNIVDTSRETITNRAGRVGDSNETFTMGRTLKDMDKQIERFEERMKMMEDRLWKQFSAMEQAINRANAQSAQLMNALGGGM